MARRCDPRAPARHLAPKSPTRTAYIADRTAASTRTCPRLATARSAFSIKLVRDRRRHRAEHRLAVAQHELLHHPPQANVHVHACEQLATVKRLEHVVPQSRAASAPRLHATTVSVPACRAPLPAAARRAARSRRACARAALPANVVDARGRTDSPVRRAPSIAVETRARNTSPAAISCGRAQRGRITQSRRVVICAARVRVSPAAVDSTHTLVHP
jgi:hypothetical protein